LEFPKSNKELEKFGNQLNFMTLLQTPELKCTKIDSSNLEYLESLKLTDKGIGLSILKPDFKILEEMENCTNPICKKLYLLRYLLMSSLVNKHTSFDFFIE
jgi:hypothetical protein